MGGVCGMSGKEDMCVCIHTHTHIFISLRYTILPSTPRSTK